jgi:homocysteine S-methyltransferase
MRIRLSDTLRKTGVMVIDGAMSTALERMGCNLADSLWSAKILTEAPEKIAQVHYDYFKAGADASITASYQATIPGFMAKGYTRKEAENFIVKSVELLREARDRWWKEEGSRSNRAYPLCLGASGPYGAYMADGSEYRGHYPVGPEELARFHRRRMELLWNAGADVLLFETHPSLTETLVEAEMAERMEVPYWISFSCMDGGHTCEGTPIETCMEALSRHHPHLVMVGVNCTRPEYMPELIRRMKRSTTLPVAVYPNSGEIYDPKTKTWHGNKTPGEFGSWAMEWMEAGASAVGGCCRTVAEDIAEVREARDNWIARSRDTGC